MIPEIRRVGQHAALYSSLCQELFDEWLNEELGPHNFHNDPLNKKFSFYRGTEHSRPEKEITSIPYFLGSVAIEPATLLWGFSPIHEPHGGPHTAARSMREFGLPHQLRDFVVEEVPYRYSDKSQPHDANMLSHDIGQAAVEIFGPDTRYSSLPTGNAGFRGIYLHQSFSEPAPQPRLSHVMSRLPRLLGDCDDIGWSLDGFARLMGWSLETTEPAESFHSSWKMISDQGAPVEVHVRFHENGLPETVRVTG